MKKTKISERTTDQLKKKLKHLEIRGYGDCSRAGHIRYHLKKRGELEGQKPKPKLKAKKKAPATASIPEAPPAVSEAEVPPKDAKSKSGFLQTGRRKRKLLPWK